MEIEERTFLPILRVARPHAHQNAHVRSGSSHILLELSYPLRTPVFGALCFPEQHSRQLATARHNPLNDITEMERVRFVMKGGMIFRNELK